MGRLVRIATRLRVSVELGLGGRLVVYRKRERERERETKESKVVYQAVPWGEQTNLAAIILIPGGNEGGFGWCRVRGTKRRSEVDLRLGAYGTSVEIGR